MTLDGRELVLASANRGKLRELEHQLASLGIRPVSQSEFNVDAVEETGLTFIENALLKAREASRVSGLPALGDDSGLVVEALDGRPGIYSARFAGEQAGDAENNAKLLEAMNGLPAERRRAHFHCCLVLLRHPHDPDPIIAQGRWQGQILSEPRGRSGFGYDPLFFDPRQGVAAAELSLAEKARISHRGIALQSLVGQLEAGH